MTSTCPNCGKPVRPGARFCGNCGTTITSAPPVQPQAAPSVENGATVACPFCGKPVRPDAKFCPSCGNTITLAAVAAASPQTSTPGGPPPAATTPPTGVQASAAGSQPPVARKPRSIIRRFGPIFLILIILGCAAVFAVGYLLGKDVFGLFGASTSTPSQKTPTHTATLSKTASPTPASPTPTPSSTFTVIPVLPATTEPPSAPTLTPAATNTQKPPFPTAQPPKHTPTKDIGIPTVPAITLPAPINTTIVQENFDRSLSMPWATWGPGQVKVVNGLLVLNSLQAGDSGLSWTHPVTITQGLTIQFTAHVDAKDPRKQFFFDLDLGDVPRKDNSGSGAVQVSVGNGVMLLQVDVSNMCRNYDLPDNNAHLFLVNITPENQVSFSMDGRPEPLCSIQAEFVSSSGFLSWRGNGWIDQVNVTRP